MGDFLIGTFCMVLPYLIPVIRERTLFNLSLQVHLIGVHEIIKFVTEIWRRCHLVVTASCVNAVVHPERVCKLHVNEFSCERALKVASHECQFIIRGTALLCMNL